MQNMKRLKHIKDAITVSLRVLTIQHYSNHFLEYIIDLCNLSLTPMLLEVLRDILQKYERTYLLTKSILLRSLYLQNNVYKMI